MVRKFPHTTFDVWTFRTVVDDPSGILTLDREHKKHRWATAEEFGDLIGFRGLKDGLASVREYVTEADPPLPELRLV